MARGRIFKRGRTWTFVVDVPPTDGQSRKQHMRGGFPTKKAAQHALSEVLAEVARGAFVMPSRQTVGEFLTDEWLPSAELTVRPTTIASYRLQVRRYIAPRIGHIPLQQLTGVGINRLYADLRRDVGLSPASVRKVHTVLRRAFRDAVRWRRLPVNVVESADPPPQRRTGGTDLHTWSPTQVRRFLDGISDERLYALWHLLVSTGMRRAEAAGLRWVDVDLHAATASIRQTRVAVGYEVTVGPPKSARSRRVVALDRGTVDVLDGWREAQDAERAQWAEAWTDSGLVFTREDGTGLHPDRISKLFIALVADSGLPRIRLHDLRHTHATIALRAGVHPKVVSERLGHSSVSFTLDVYSHAVPAMQADAADTIADLIHTDGDDQDDDGAAGVSARTDPAPTGSPGGAHARPEIEEQS